VIDGIYTAGLQLSSAPWWTAAGWPVVWGLIKIVCVIVPLLVAVAYMTLWERKLLGYMQVRQGPNRVGPWGLWQPFADGIKLLTKELIQPTAASKGLSGSGRCWRSCRRSRPGWRCRSRQTWRWRTSMRACS